LLVVGLLVLSACDRQPTEEYTPPQVAGIAYVLGDCDHIAVLDLATGGIARLKPNTPLVDIALSGDDLVGLTPDGALVTIDRTAGTTTVIERPLRTGQAMAEGAADGELWLLGKEELCHYRLGRGIEQRYSLPAPATSLFFDSKRSRLVLIDRPSSKLVVFDPQTLTTEKTLPFAGNSVHHGRTLPPTAEYWIAEGNEYMNGEPYGVGYAKDHPAMPGGINVIDPATGKQTDFIMVGGNVVDIAFSPDGQKAYVAVSQLPEYTEATLSLINTAERRVRAEFRLCDACHMEQGVEPEREHILVRALTVDWNGAGQ